MNQADLVRRDELPQQEPHLVLRICSILLVCASAVLLLGTLVVGFQKAGIFSVLLACVLAALCIVLFLHTRFLLLARKEHRLTASVLDATEREFQSVFETALDSILILDDDAICRDANPAAEQLLGLGRQELLGQPLVRFHKDASEFGKSWGSFLADGQKQGQSELRRKDGSEIVIEFTAKAHVLPSKNVVILRDVTRRRQAEQKVLSNLAIAQSAWAEADALRKATLALAQNLRMDDVLDTLLDSLRSLVPYESAQVLLLEGDSRLFLARESIQKEDKKQSGKYPLTFDATDFPALQRVIATQRGVLLADTKQQAEWRDFKGRACLRSWLSVPLLASSRVLGLLCLGHSEPNSFTQEHLRITKSLAVAAAVAIQNARLYECAEIYGTELEKRISDLREAQKALKQSEEGRRTSEERFKCVFRSSPIAFSITALADGRFVDVNEAFERRYGYSRAEALGRTTAELGIWEDPKDRDKMIAEIQHGMSIRSAVTRVRLESGEIVISVYSAEAIQLDGVPCLLVVSEDLASLAETK